MLPARLASARRQHHAMLRLWLLIVGAARLAGAVSCAWTPPTGTASSVVTFLGSTAAAAVQPAAEADLRALRRRLAAVSIGLVTDSSSNAAAAAAAKGAIMEISSVCRIFDAAMRLGGARSLLDLLEVDVFLEESTAAAVAARMVNNISIAKARRKGQALYYQVSAAIEPASEYVQGGLWWLRHWAGEFLQRRAAAESIDTSTLLDWVHQQQMCKQVDFAAVSFEHAVVWNSLASSSSSKGQGELGGTRPSYPTTAAKAWCAARQPFSDEAATDAQNEAVLRASRFLQTNLVRECLHSFGHAVFYALLASSSQALREATGTLPCHTLRPRGFTMPAPTMEQGLSICARAPNWAHTGNCINGLMHSYGLLAVPSERNESLLALANQMLGGVPGGGAMPEFGQRRGAGPDEDGAARKHLYLSRREAG